MRRPLSSEGRWGGRATRRPLPDAALELAELDPEVRAELARIWWMQASTEGRVATSFAIVRDALEGLGADTRLVALAERAVDDEHRHAALCEQMARTLLGRAISAPPELDSPRPTHPEARSERERRALFVVGQCALNETFASGYLGAALAPCKSPLARAAIRELLEDEIDHSRLGWAYLQTLPADLRPVISDWLVPLAVTNLREWRKSSVSESALLEQHGVPRAEAVRAALEDVVRGVLLPGFAHVGLDVRGLEAWVRQGMPTSS